MPRVSSTRLSQAEHCAEATRLLFDVSVGEYKDGLSTTTADQAIARAHVHALLAAIPQTGDDPLALLHHRLVNQYQLRSEHVAKSPSDMYGRGICYGLDEAIRLINTIRGSVGDQS